MSSTQATTISAPQDKDGATARGRYAELCTLRSQVLNTAIDAAQYTIPHIMPPGSETGDTYNEPFLAPYQGTGARGVRNLASKLTLALFPPSKVEHFFRLGIDELEIPDVEKKTVEVFNDAFSKIEESVITRLEQKGLRAKANQTFRQLIVVGNLLWHFNDDGRIKIIKLNRYVVKRDGTDKVIELIIQEPLSPATLPAKVKDMWEGESVGNSVSERLELYTWVKWNNDSNRYEWHQEFLGNKVPDSEGFAPADKCPFLVLRWTEVDGEDYGRSYVEELLGDLASLESLCRSMQIGTEEMAKIRYLLNPNSVIDIKTLSEAESGSFNYGVADHVGTVQANKYADFQVAMQEVTRLEKNLSHAFLLFDAVQRDAERVTAEEIHEAIKQLEDNLGGIYSTLGPSLQLPLVKISMVKLRGIPVLPDKTVQIQIVTGLEALGRRQDSNRIFAFLSRANEVLGPDEVKRWVRQRDTLIKMAVSEGVPGEALIRTEEEVAAQDKQQNMQGLVGQLGGDVIKAGTEISKQQQQVQQQ